MAYTAVLAAVAVVGTAAQMKQQRSQQRIAREDARAQAASDAARAASEAQRAQERERTADRIAQSQQQAADEAAARPVVTLDDAESEQSRRRRVQATFNTDFNAGSAGPGSISL